MQQLFTTPLAVGSQGLDVFLLQLFLCTLKMKGNVVPDGEYGEQTKIAVENLQFIAQLPVTGIFGPETLRALNERTCEETGYDLELLQINPDNIVRELELPVPA